MSFDRVGRRGAEVARDDRLGSSGRAGEQKPSAYVNTIDTSVALFDTRSRGRDRRVNNYVNDFNDGFFSFPRAPVIIRNPFGVESFFHD